jgi:hypothetical protein
MLAGVNGRNIGKGALYGAIAGFAYGAISNALNDGLASGQAVGGPNSQTALHDVAPNVQQTQMQLVVNDSLFAGPGANPYHFYAGGTWTEEGCFDAELGQAVKIYVKTVNVLGTTMSIEASSPIEQIQQSILLPLQEHVFKFFEFGPVPLPWKFCISTVSDAFNVLYQIWSTWVPGMPSER